MEATDTLGRWMAHYLAERISEAENAPEREKKQIKAACAEEILRIWAHRQTMPGGFRPFRDYGPVVRTLQSLDLNPELPRYFDRLIADADKEEDKSEAKQWLNASVNIDSAAKVLIRYCLATAAAAVVDKSRPWVALAESVSNENDSNIQTYRWLLNDAELVTGADPSDRERKQLEEVLADLNGFQSIARLIRKSLKKRLELCT